MQLELFLFFIKGSFQGMVKIVENQFEINLKNNFKINLNRLLNLVCKIKKCFVEDHGLFYHFF